MINKIINYLKKDEEREGVCEYCSKYTTNGSLFIKRDSMHNAWKEILVCEEESCYWISRRDNGITYSIMSKKETLILILEIIFFIVVLLFSMILLNSIV